MLVLSGPFYAVALLLMAAGTAKIGRPEPAAGALRATPLPNGRWFVRFLGVGELAVGSLALATGSRWAASLLAVAYLGFAVFVVGALTAGTPLASCGCFGRPDTPPTMLHVVVDLAAAGVALLVAIRPIGPLPDVLAALPWSGVPLVALAGTIASLLYLLLDVVPLTMAAVADVAAARRGTRVRVTPRPGS